MLQYIEQIESVQRQLAKMTWRPALAVGHTPDTRTGLRAPTILRNIYRLPGLLWNPFQGTALIASAFDHDGDMVVREGDSRALYRKCRSQDACQSDFEVPGMV